MTAGILVIEDEKPLLERMVKTLEYEGLKARGVDNGAEGIAIAREIKPDVIICDVLMPETDGQAVVSAIRTDPSIQAVPIIMATALDDRKHQRKFMELGVDDYLTKPFTAGELVAAVRTQLQKASRRQQGANTPPPIQSRSDALVYSFAGWTFDPASNRLTSDRGGVQTLSPSENRLLLILVQNPNKVLGRDDLFKHMYQAQRPSGDRSIDILIGRLRSRLLDDARDPQILETIRNSGYLLRVKVTTVRGT